MRVSRLLAGAAIAALLLQPGLAAARAGHGMSFGSRGWHTFSAPAMTRTAPRGAAPIERSYTPRQAERNYGYRGSPYYHRSGFGSGFLGGLLGVGLGSLLFGHAFGGGFGFIWFVIRLLILFWIVRWVWRLITGRRRFAFAGMGGMFNGRTTAPGRPASGYAPPPVQIGPDDYRAFEQILREVQDAWSRGDLAELSRLATPEMVAYFSEQLSDYASRGERNSVTDVRLIQGDLAESWSEQDRAYATVAMRFGMIDVTRDSTGRIIDGSPTEHVIEAELWTFLRSRGGAWILSAIQQAR